MTFASEEVLQQPERLAIPRSKSAQLGSPALSHLKALEAESIYILREAAAEFARPVMLRLESNYSRREAVTPDTAGI